ncbi:ras guanine nucleotide exchange factor domain-containing protein [Mycena rebaudengoi]|nr:ras guanine nucleotide exchange factor domain-containing protein [Mycena rebaudengoi]
MPWYLRPTYSPTDILVDLDGSVRAGTVPALVERLTAHEQGAPAFIRSFMMTFKMFTAVDELFDLLVQRFWMQPPPELTPTEREIWGTRKQQVVQARVLNSFKCMIQVDGILESDDLFVLERIKQFITTADVARFPTAKQLLSLIERAQKGDSIIKMVTASRGEPPPPVVPKTVTNQKLQLRDIDPLELARQLTIKESGLYQRIRPKECLQRAATGHTTENNDNVTAFVCTTSKIPLWVAQSILCHEESQRRAYVVHYWINRCRALNNFSTLAAIAAGLSMACVSRLNQTWEHIDKRCMGKLAACKTIIDSNKGFLKYRRMLPTLMPPCMPLVGLFLSTLQTGVPCATLVTFKKWANASQVIDDVKRWQEPYNLHVLPSVQAYIEESLSVVNPFQELSERLSSRSLVLEPRDSVDEDEKMGYLLREGGFF